MTMHTLLRRSGAVLTGLGVTAALTLITTTDAQAAVHGEYGAIGSSFASYNGPTIGGTCNLTSGDSSPESDIANFSHGTRKRSVSLNTVYTASDNLSDTTHVQGHIDTSLTLARRGKDLRSFELTAGGKLSVSHSVGGSHCRAGGSVIGATQVVFTEHKKGWFYLSHDSKKPNSALTAVIFNADTGKVVTVSFFEGTASHETTRALLKPGRYVLIETQAGLAINSGGILAAKGGPSSRTVHHSMSIRGEFKPLH
jgi:hypothetical protein